MAFDRTKPADTDYISASAANLRENFRALAEDTRLYGTGAPESSAGQNGWRYVDTATGDEYLKVNGAWTKKTDLAALIRDLFVGTVSENEGVPTGAIIERGNNANGYYVKFADGTLISFFENVTLSYFSVYVLSYTWTFPVSFITPPIILKTFEAAPLTAQMPLVLYETDKSVSSAKIGALSRSGVYTSGSTQIISVFAIGRWY